ncbi:MAG: alcohol dehydrogenase catalytic domain-containing protein [Cytophagaceae bacterium]
MKIEKEDFPKPGAGEVSIEVKAIGLNYADIFQVLGLYKAAPKTAFIPGLEFSGIVTDVGDGKSEFTIGDRVMGVTKFGAYVSHINIDANYLVSIPGEWTFQQGAAFPVQVLTAYYALRPLGNLQEGQTVLIQSAAGGVGLLANRIAKKFNAYTIGVVGTADKVPLLQKERYDAGIIRSKDFKKDVLTALEGRELNLVLEATGGKLLEDALDLLAPSGRLIAYGSAQYTPSGNAPNYPLLLWKYLRRPRIDPHAMISQNKSVMGFNLIFLYERVHLMKEMMEEVMKLKLEPPLVSKIYEFDEIPQALTEFKSGKTFGKLIVNL